MEISTNEQKARIKKRNDEIRREYLNMRNMYRKSYVAQKLSEKYFLSEKTIINIIYRNENHNTIGA
jgi:hypothetical protein